MGEHLLEAGRVSALHRLVCDVLSGSADNTLKLWSSTTGKALHTVYGVAAFTCVAVTRGQFAAGDALGNVWILDWDEPGV